MQTSLTVINGRNISHLKVLKAHFINLIIQPFPKRQILDNSILKEFSDDNFKFDENERKFCKRVENTMGKGAIASYEQFLISQQCFQKTLAAHVKTTACLGMGKSQLLTHSHTMTPFHAPGKQAF